jgi:hypothetical protein
VSTPLSLRIRALHCEFPLQTRVLRTCEAA